MTWDEVPLGQVATVERDGIAPEAISSGTPYVGLENIERGGNLVNVQTVDAGALASTKFRFGGCHVLFGKLRPNLAKVTGPSFAGVCSTDILPIRPHSDLDRNYLIHWLLTPASVSLATLRASGANLPRLSPTELLKFRIPLPPLEEQRRIADILGHADTLRAMRRETLTLLDDLSQSIFHDMFGDPATNIVRWPMKTIGELADVQGGLQVSSSRFRHVRQSPYLRVANVYRGRLDLDEVKLLGVTDAEFSRTVLEPNDLLIVEGHGNPREIGRAALWSGAVESCVHQNHLIRARFDHETIVPTFAEAYINSPGGRRHLLRSGKTTSGLNTISTSNVRSTPLAMPPLVLQREFRKRVRGARGMAALHAVGQNILDDLFASLQQRAFAGEL